MTMHCFWKTLISTLPNSKKFLIWISCSFKKGASDKTISYFVQSFWFSGLLTYFGKRFGEIWSKYVVGNREQRENKYIFFKFWTVIIWSNSQTLFFSLPYTNQGIEYLNIKVTFTFSIFPKRPDRKQICRPFKYIFKNPNNFIQFMYFCFKNFKKDSCFLLTFWQCICTFFYYVMY